MAELVRSFTTGESRVLADGGSIGGAGRSIGNGSVATPFGATVFIGRPHMLGRKLGRMLRGRDLGVGDGDKFTKGV